MDIYSLTYEEKANIYIECLGGYTSIAYLKRCPEYMNAKKNGDIKAAGKIIEMCADEQQINLIRQKYSDAILIPIITKNNAFPVAFADYIGLAVCMSVRCIQLKSRKDLSAIERLLYKPYFYGYIAPNKSYILVDDVMTQGGTFASLIKFTIKAGAYVCAVIVLAYARWSKKLTSAYKNSIILTAHFGEEILDLLKNFNIHDEDINFFTHSEISYLLKFSSVTNIRKKLAKIAQNRLRSGFLRVNG